MTKTASKRERKITYTTKKTNTNMPSKIKKKPKIRKEQFDKPFFLIIITLLVLGTVMMFSASYYWGLVEPAGDGFIYAKKQIVIAGCGLLAMIFISKIPYNFYKNKKVVAIIFIGSFLLLGYTSFFGREHNGARRWIKIGVEFQSSEIMKFAIVILFSYLISVNYKRMKTFKYGVLPFFIILGAVAALMLKQPHLSGTVLICSIGIVMIFVGGAKFSHLLGTAVLGLVGVAGVIFYKIAVEGVGYFVTRIKSWIDPFSDVGDGTWQTCQSLIAIGSGGLFGMGFGESRQKYLYLPESKNDFVFAIVCEELGFIGALLVIILFLMFTFRGFYIASKAVDKFGMMLVVGLTVQITIQALLNIAVVSNTVPNTGISLPFFSYGGTALAMQLAQMGVILNVSRYSLIED